MTCPPGSVFFQDTLGWHVADPCLGVEYEILEPSDRFLCSNIRQIFVAFYMSVLEWSPTSSAPSRLAWIPDGEAVPAMLVHRERML